MSMVSSSSNKFAVTKSWCAGVRGRDTVDMKMGSHQSHSLSITLKF